MNSYVFKIIIFSLSNICVVRGLHSIFSIASTNPPTTSSIDKKLLLSKLIDKKDLSSTETEGLWTEILSDCDPIYVGAILTSLRSKGETPEEIAGMVRAMKKVCNSGI